MAITQLTTFELLPPHASTSTSLTSPPLNHLLTSLCARQPVYSAYPVTLYTDLHSSRIFYLLSGWRDPSAISSWQKEFAKGDTVYGGLYKKLKEFIKVRECVFLDMDFDRIPRGAKGNGRVLCVVRHSIGGDGRDGNLRDEDVKSYDGDNGREGSVSGGGNANSIAAADGTSHEVSGTTGTIGDDESSGRSEFQSDEDDHDSDTELCRIEWIGGGHTLRVSEHHSQGTGKIFHSFIMYNEGTSESVLRRRLGLRIRSGDFTAMRRISIPRPVRVPAALDTVSEQSDPWPLGWLKV